MIHKEKILVPAEGLEPSSRDPRGSPSVPAHSIAAGFSPPSVPVEARDSVMDSVMTKGGDVFKILDLSTAHITERTAQWIAADLEDPDGFLCGAKWAEYGWILQIVGTLDDDDAIGSIPESLAIVVRYAHTLGCTFIKLDCDACAISSLPTYNW